MSPLSPPSSSEPESGWTRLLSSGAVIKAGGVAERVAAVLQQAEAVVREAASFVDSCLVKDADDDDGMDEPTVVLSATLALALQKQKGRFVVKMPFDAPDKYKSLLTQSIGNRRRLVFLESIDCLLLGGS
jgi:hypothetical protein